MKKAQSTEAPRDLQVPIQRRLAGAAGFLAQGIETVGHVGDQLLETLRDAREMQFVAGDQRRVGLAGEAIGKVEHAGGGRQGNSCF